MPDNQDVVLVIRVLNPQNTPLGGVVDVEVKRNDTNAVIQKQPGVAASQDIPISGLDRFAGAIWTITVTREQPFEVQPQQLLLPTSGSKTLVFTFSAGVSAQDGVLIVKVIDSSGNFVGGLADITVKNVASGATSELPTANASQPITFAGLQPQGSYQVTVKPASMTNAQSQSVTLPAKGSATIVFSFAPVAPQEFVVNGYLVFDHGLPADTITLRLYNIGFGDQDTKLGETKTDSQGNYSLTYSPPGPGAPNIQIRVLDLGNKEVTVSHTKYNAQPRETLNLIVPSSVRPLAPEFERLAADMARQIGTIANLGQAKEDVNQQDLTLLNQSSNWDARLVAFAATAAQHITTTGLGHDVLYSLFRLGLPTDPSLLAQVPSGAVQQALTKANQVGVVGMTDQQIAAATTAFQDFATKTRLASTAPGAASNFQTLLALHLSDGNQLKAFTDLYFSNPAAPDFWTQAVNLKIPSETLEALKLQGKFLYLTFNSAPLSQKLQQDISSLSNISQLADKDYDLSDTWQTALSALAATEGSQGLIPPAYPDAAAFAGDLARKVRFSFPTQVAARMLERMDPKHTNPTTPNVTAFLRAAAPLGYSLGRTPLHAFMNNYSKSLPAMDKDSTESLKTLHRLYQVTPSSESLQAAMTLGFTSARDIASYTLDEFTDNFASAFPAGEASLVFGQAQTVSAVTFNIFSTAKQLDTTPPIYAVSSSDQARQNAKSSIVQQFPSMASLFGNLDFCECEDCRSVLSPAAYFVDVLEFLNGSTANPAGNTPLDVLIGSKDPTAKGAITGRRPDLGALPLTCENTNTAMPYIDLVNEILEYYIAYTHLDSSLAYDTGSATTADLTAEPQNILPQVYNSTLKQAIYPLNLPFDLWIETVRGFLNYFKSPLAQVLDTLRPVDNLELFADANSYPYYRAQMLAEGLGLSSSEYGVLTVTASAIDPLSDTNWFNLYGRFTDEAAALNYLRSAENLSMSLGLTYQELTELLTTGFLNPALYSLIFQFERFGIDMSDAFSYTNQPGYPAFTAAEKAAFEASLSAITTRYKKQNGSSTFDAKTWLTNILPANYSQKVLVLADPDSGCNLSATTLQYADNATGAAPLDFVKFNLFVRLWKKLGWSLDETDRALQLFLPSTLPKWGDPTFASAFSSAWKTALVYLAHLDDLNTTLAPAMGRVALLPLWSSLPVQGDNSLYAQLFLTPSVLNNDWAFDDPNGLFPTPLSDLGAPAWSPPLTPFSAHLPSVQGALGLTFDEVTAIFLDAGSAVTTVTVVLNQQNVTVPSFTLTNLSICYRYSSLAKCLQIEVADLISLKAMSGLDPFHPLSGNPLTQLSDDVLFNQTLLFVKQVQAVHSSGFTVEDLRYLLRHQFDPVGKYQTDPNALMAVLQSVATGLQQIQSQNAVLANLKSLSESLIDQTLSGLFPAPILKALFGVLTNSQTYTASQSGVAQIDPTPFAQETGLIFSYDSTTGTQSVGYQGLLLNWKKAELKNINNTMLFTGLLDGIQQQALATLDKSVGDILGVWASLVEYEAVQTGAIAGLPVKPLTQADAALSLGYDQSDSLQWLGYRGVLTDFKKSILTAVSLTAPQATLLAGLLNDIQQQAMPAYLSLIGSFVAMLTNVQTYEAQSPVTAATQVNVNNFFSLLAAAQQAGTITDPVPQLQFISTPSVQTLICQGLLTANMQSQLATLMPTSSVLASLLQAVRTQAVNLFQDLATNLLTIAPTDLDTYAQSFLGLDISKQQKQVKADLVSVFLPLLTEKLSRQLILQSLSTNLGSDPSVTEALATDAALLTDPSDPGKSLLGAFLAVGQQGVSALYYTSSDGSGTAQASGIAITTDTADPSNNKPGTTSAHFEGYLQVATDGPYRFFAELGDAGAAALFQLDAPDPKALLPNPVIPSTPAAAKDHDEISQFVQLKGGVLYHFTLDFSNLKSKGASLLVQGETLAKGPLSQVVLYPQTAIVGFTRAKTLLAKALQILQVTGLDEREISYLVANASQFGKLKLSSLPTQASDDTLVGAIALFSQFLTLADYADLRKGPAGGSDGLIDVFQSVGQTFSESAVSPDANGNPAAPWVAFALLTRRDPQTVRAVAQYLGLLEQVILYQGQPGGFPGVDAGSSGWTDPSKVYWPQFSLIGNGGKAVTYQANDAGMAVFTNAAGGQTAYVSVFDPTGVGQPPAGPAHADLSPVLHYNQPGYVQIGTITSSAFASTASSSYLQITAIGDFANNKGIRRIWQALQLVQVIGIPVASLTASTAIASPAPSSPDHLAANFKNAVKAQYTPDTWRPIAQSVFDKLRQKKRDALVAYLVANQPFEDENQLFEYFLVDPGMEPVVQTSRLRLAMSSVQTFIQRCLLNLENANTNTAIANTNTAINVAPSAIDANAWEWMKRYRVWQANREIFLYPENWMIPELRLDKTDLFEALESSLLQGDVTNDLVEDAFYTYLKGLDLRARLDIVAMYLDQDVSNAFGVSTLYVLGRTYGHPHKYFYRTYSNGTWSGWITVTPDIESDHIVLVVWKGRLNLFWVTFITQTQAAAPPSDVDTRHVADLSFDGLTQHISNITPQVLVRVQLHWSEYVQGKWSNRISSDVNSYGSVPVVPAPGTQFDPGSVYIHISKEVDSNGNEGAVRIHLDFPSLVQELGPQVIQSGLGFTDSTVQFVFTPEGHAFRVTSKNCAPDFGPQYWEAAASKPYPVTGIDATLYTGSSTLQATFESKLSSDGTSTTDTEQILQSVNNYALLTCANPVVPPYIAPTGPSFYQDAGGLVAPFFFKDTSNPNASSSNFADELTFFVQPSLTEKTLEQWEWWAPVPVTTGQNWSDTNLFTNFNVIAQVPTAGPAPINPGDPVYSVYPVQNTSDWVTNPATVVSYGNSLISQSGGISAGNFSALALSVGVTAGFAMVGRQGFTLSKVQATQKTQATSPLRSFSTNTVRR